MSGYISAMNGKKGGRPKPDTEDCYRACECKNVTLSYKQYLTLLTRYGENLLTLSIKILENWLQNNPAGYKYRGKNNYAFFRADGWLINTAKRICC